MRDDNKKVLVSKLPAHVQVMLKNRGYLDQTISAVEVTREYAGWNLGDESWADNIILIYNDVIDVAIEN